jgi:GTP-binding protein YchF
LSCAERRFVLSSPNPKYNVMNVGIIGLPQTGKKTLFELLVGKGAIGHNTDPKKTLRGVADVLDERFDDLVEIYTPRKQTKARVDILLPQRIEEQSVSKGDIFKDLAEVEVFCHVVRAFEDDAIYHIWGSVDPIRDIEYVNTEFVLHDLMFVEKRIERIEKNLMKVKNKSAVVEVELLKKFKSHLEDEQPLRTLEITTAEDKLIRSNPLLSLREMVVVLNVADSNGSATKQIEELNKRFAAVRITCLQLAVEMETEIAALETESERKEFMEEMGIEETALHVLTRQSIDSLGLESFFTVASEEVRQWLVRRGSTAVEAAGKIHTDLARGFIRAEVIKLDDLLELKSEEKIKSAGKLGVKGRDYIVEDGDILFIRFNV